MVMVLKNGFSLKSWVGQLNEGRVIWNRVVDVPEDRVTILQSTLLTTTSYCCVTKLFLVEVLF